MHILVCVKQVIDTATALLIRDDGRWIRQDDESRWQINYYDTFALEEAIRIKECHPGMTVDALSLGPERVESTLRWALAMGADHAIHLLTDEDVFIDAEATARIIAAVVRPRCYDLAFTGVMSEDVMQRLTGPMLAAIWRIPCAASVVEEHLMFDENAIHVVCELEGGFREAVRLPLPALLTIQSGINRPRYASLSNRLRAKKQVIEQIPVNALPSSLSGSYPAAVRLPERSASGTILEGTAVEKADALVALLHEKSLI